MVRDAQGSKVPIQRLAGLEDRARRLAEDDKTPMHVALDGKAAGIVAVADTVKDDSKAAIESLKAMGLEVVMMTATTSAPAGPSRGGSGSSGYWPRCSLRTRPTTSRSCSSRADASSLPRRGESSSSPARWACSAGS
jgi:hypothetical protein